MVRDISQVVRCLLRLSVGLDADWAEKCNFSMTPKTRRGKRGSRIAHDWASVDYWRHAQHALDVARKSDSGSNDEYPQILPLQLLIDKANVTRSNK